MKKFILGFLNEDDFVKENLREFKSKKEADFEAEEWCEVEAETLEEAKDKYEEAFKKWQKSENEKDVPVKNDSHIQFCIAFTIEKGDNTEDHFENFEDEKEAERRYEKVLEKENLYTANLCKVIKTTG